MKYEQLYLSFIDRELVQKEIDNYEVKFPEDLMPGSKLSLMWEWLQERIPYLIKLEYRYYDIKRWFISKYQRYKYGCSDEECWNLDYTIAKFVLIRLKRFKEINKCSVPPDISSEEWESIVDELIWTFDYIVDDDKYLKCPVDILYKIFGFDKESHKFEGNRFNRELTPDEKARYRDYHLRIVEMNERKERGLMLFSKWFEHLWD